jgi:hypothetical protein
MVLTPDIKKRTNGGATRIGIQLLSLPQRLDDLSVDHQLMS